MYHNLSILLAVTILGLAVRPPQEAPQFKVSADLVLLGVTVKDAQGRTVAGLEQADFQVFEDGRSQPVRYFEGQNAPMAAVLLIDASSSMRGGPLEEAREAAREFNRHRNPDDEIAVLAFNQQAVLIQNFSRDPEEVSRSLGRLTASGGTALFDALEKALACFSASAHRRQAVVLLSDGKDMDSNRTFGEIERVVGTGNIVIFSVGEYSPEERELFLERGPYYKEPELEVNLNPAWILRRLAELSGGTSFFPLPNDPLAAFFKRIADELHSQYVLGFVPGEPPGKPAFHSLSVRVEDGSGRPLQIRTRSGYWR